MANNPDPTDLCVDRIRANWADFLETRQEQRMQQESGDQAPERAVEGILEALFTRLLDWSPSDIRRREGDAGLLLSRSGTKRLVVAARRPGSLMWYRRTVQAALQGVRKQADEEGVKCVAVSDGVMLYAADIADNGLQDRVFVYLGSAEPQGELCWLSVHRLSGSRWGRQGVMRQLLPEMASPSASRARLRGGVISHPRYGLPARCFAYAPHREYPDSWKLPYLLADGSVDTKRLPKAIQSLVSNYRGAKVRGIPASELPDVLVKLARAAASLGKMPHQSRKPARTYQRLAEVLAQLGRLDEIVNS